jgi:hypothetical protein
MAENTSSEPRRASIEPVPLESEVDDVAWRRVRAGLLLEGGQVPPETVRRWQDAARGPGFDADQCAAEVLAEAAGEGADAGVRTRSGALLRELLLARDARSRPSRARRRTRTGVALLLSQVYMLVVWAGLALAGALLLRMRGFEFDALLDRLLGVFH